MHVCLHADRAGRTGAMGAETEEPVSTAFFRPKTRLLRVLRQRDNAL